METALTLRARAFAEKAHGTQLRKYSDEPYTVHTTAVAKLLAAHGFGETVIAAAHLHDVLEDTDTTADELRAEFGDAVTALVLEVTDVSKKSDGNRAVRKEIDRQHLAKASYEGQSIKLADLIDNTVSIVERDPGFAPTYLREKAALLEVLTDSHPGLYRRAIAVVGT